MRWANVVLRSASACLRSWGPLAALCAVTLGAATAHAGGPCPARTKHQSHVVERGETLSAIAKDHCVSIDELVASNRGLQPDRLREGEKLNICRRKHPERAKRRRRCRGGGVIHEHRVKRGESLARIARRYAVETEQLLRRNEGSLQGDATNLRAGQTLEVCAARARIDGARVCGYRTPLHRHQVIPGEWLAEIASRYGVRQRDVLRLNPKLRGNPDYLRTGSRIRVCPDIPPRTRERIQHRVQAGQTLASIADRYDLHPQQLLRFQRGRLDNPDRLRVGQRLVVWRDGGIVEGFGGADEERGALVGGIQLPAGAHYTIKNPRLAWATPGTVRLVQAATARFHRRTRGAGRVRIGDISRKGGGKFPPHKSHRTGKDVDVGYALRPGSANGRRFARATEANLDRARTWALVNAFLDTDRVRYIFMDYRIQGWLYEHAKRRGTPQSTLDELFQYPRGRRRAYGIIRNDPGHDDHFHVRFD